MAKIMPKSEMSFTRFAFELNVAHSMRHPNLVRVKEGIEEKGNYIIIMERWALQSRDRHVMNMCQTCDKHVTVSPDE